MELQTKGEYETVLDEDFWYGWSIYVPADWVFDANDQKVVHQWHTASGQPGDSAKPISGQATTSPPGQVHQDTAAKV